VRVPPPLRVTLGSSRIARAIVVGLAISTAIVSARLPLPAWTTLVAWLALAVWAGVRWRSFGTEPQGGRVLDITLSGDRAIETRDASHRRRAGVVRAGTYVAPSLTAIVWKPDDARFSRSILILPDMLGAEDFRLLRVRLRYGRSVETAAAPASQA
jgi:hypothetical protein